MATTNIERHPDIVSLRMKYEQANETYVAHIVNGFALMAGLYLAISPWVVGFQTLTPLAIVNVLTGFVLVALAFGFSAARSTPPPRWPTTSRSARSASCSAWPRCS